MANFLTHVGPFRLPLPQAVVKRGHCCENTRERFLCSPNPPSSFNLLPASGSSWPVLIICITLLSLLMAPPLPCLSVLLLWRVLQGYFHQRNGICIVVLWSVCIYLQCCHIRATPKKPQETSSETHGGLGASARVTRGRVWSGLTVALSGH